jgi:hypothetical protein
MTIRVATRAKLVVDIPAGRYRTNSAVGREPHAGDTVVLDQGFTGADGLPMVIVYFPDIGRDYLYEAEVYESELE